MKVLLASDGSENAEAAAQMVAQLPRAEGLNVIVLSVIQLPDLHYTLANITIRDSYIREKRKAFQHAFERMKPVLTDASIELDFVEQEGHSGKTIVEEAEQRDVDLIVIGAVGESLVDYLLLGSTSDFVVTHAQRSVLVVRPDGRCSPDMRFLVAYDGSETSAQAFLQLARSGLAVRSTVDIVNVLPPPVPLMTAEDEQVIRQSTKIFLEESLEKLITTETLASLDMTCHVLESDHVGRALVEFAKEHESDVIAMGSTGRGLLSRFLLGSVSRFVLHYAPCSVWIGRETPQE